MQIVFMAGAMTKNLPSHNFKWMDRNQKLENWREISCFLEVDLEYPDELHILHNDYPLSARENKNKWS